MSILLLGFKFKSVFCLDCKLWKQLEMNSSTELSKLYRLGNDKADLILRQESVIAAMSKNFKL